MFPSASADALMPLQRDGQHCAGDHFIYSPSFPGGFISHIRKMIGWQGIKRK
jgi:hypothetical protein